MTEAISKTQACALPKGTQDDRAQFGNSQAQDVATHVGRTKHGGEVVRKDLRLRNRQHSHRLEVTILKEDGIIRITTAGKSSIKDLHVVPTNQYIGMTTKAQPRFKDHISSLRHRTLQHIEVVSRIKMRD